MLKLDKRRHFIFVDDSYDFETKEDKLFYRGAIYQPHRVRFYMKQFFDKEREFIISLLVMEKYFYYTEQIEKMSL